MTSPILVTPSAPVLSDATSSGACGTPAITCGYSVGTAMSPGTVSSS
jgi:hypothetical protein